MNTEPTRLSKKMHFYICESFVNELKKVTEQYDDVEINSYKARCKYQHIREPFENIDLKDEKSYVLGGCSLEKSNLTPNLQMQKEESCFYMFAPKTLLKNYIEEGAYIITPGWLHDWKSYVQEFWGFDKETASSFFHEFCKKLVLLDTLREAKTLEEIKEFSSFVGISYEIVPIGLEYFNLYVQNIVKEDIAKRESEKNKKKFNDVLQNMSNYAVAFDFLSKLNEKLDEKEIVDKIVEIFAMLFAPENVTYLMIKDSKIVDTISSFESSTNGLQNRFLSMEDNYVLVDDGFAIKLSYANEIVGIVSVEKIAFMQYIEKYLNLAISISEVCALAVENARNFLKTKEIESQLAQHAKLVSMGEMMGSIAHQWRQPLNQLNINIEMLEDYYEAGKVDAEFVEKFIAKNTETIQFLSKTISDFSNFFRINKQKIHFSIQEAIEGVLNIIGAQLEKNSIVCEIVGQDLKPFGLPSEFQQVILNIINNAKDAILEANQGENGKITIKLEKQGKRAFIVITDNGGGIPQDIIDRIFEPYFTTKEQGKGIGMGLYISKMIIEENLGWKLNVTNSDIGAVFKIELELEDE